MVNQPPDQNKKLRNSDQGLPLIIMVKWRFGSRNGGGGAEAEAYSTSNGDFQPDFVSEGSLKFALEKGGNDSGPSYRKMFPYHQSKNSGGGNLLTDRSVKRRHRELQSRYVLRWVTQSDQ